MPVYHVWFATKRRLWLLQDEVLESVRELIFQIAAEKQIELLAHEAVVDHVQLLLRASDRTELATYMNLLKGVSARRAFQRFPELKLDAHITSFWQSRYGCREVPEAAVPTVRRYIRTQWDRLDDYIR